MNENNDSNQNTKNDNIQNSISSTPSQITDNIYLGNLLNAQNIKGMLELGIKKVLSLITETQLLVYPKEIEHKLINIPDLPRQNIIQYFDECLLFIDNNKKILVHCFAGASRSATIVIAYIMWKYQLGFSEAFETVKKRRPIISPNIGFIRQLKIFDKLLKKNKYDIHSINFKQVKYPSFYEQCCL